LLEGRQLAPDKNPKRALVAAMLQRIYAEWSLDEFSSRSGFFFCSKGLALVMIEITPSDPGARRARYYRLLTDYVIRESRLSY
jgi:hypothetical protein